MGENPEIVSKDYLSQFGQIPRFEELLATMRSMEISANVIIQNLSQLKKMYKDSWENVLGNCDSLLFLGGQEPTTLEHVSKMLGKETIDTRSRNRTRGKNGSTSENDGILGRELMTVDELKVMKDNECILFVRGIYPFFCDKFVIEKHPNYRFLEDADKSNAFPLNNVNTEKFNYDDEQNDEELHREAVDELDLDVISQIGEAVAVGRVLSDHNAPGKDVPKDEIDQSVTMEEIESIQNHVHSVYAEIPKEPKNGGSEAAEISFSDKAATLEPFIETAEESYLDVYDEF